MLAEFHEVKQEPGTRGHRRWFQDEAMELIVWYDRAGTTEGFQLCYQGSDFCERALTWRPGVGFSHARVDTGDTRPDKNLSPILVQDGPVPWSRLEADFAERAEQLEPDLRDLVRGAFAGRPA